MRDLVIDPTQLNREYLTESAGLNQSAILTPKKIWPLQFGLRLPQLQGDMT
jgi:hypothetical protein